MKRLLVCIIILILLCCSCAKNVKTKVDSASSFIPSQVEFEPIEAKALIVNKKDISDTATAFVYSDHYAVIPLIAVSKALGAEVKWESKTKAVIAINGDKYILDTAKHELKKAESDHNIFIGVPGAPGNVSGYNQQVGEEYYIDNWRVQSFLNCFGVSSVEIFFTTNRIYINKDEKEPDVYGEFSVEDYSQEIQSKAIELETATTEEQSVYSKKYGDLSTAISIKHRALEVFEQLYWDFYTLHDLKVYKDEASGCWLVKTKSVEELRLYKNEVVYAYTPDYDYEYELSAIFTDDGKLLLVKENK